MHEKQKFNHEGHEEHEIQTTSPFETFVFFVVKKLT